MKTQPSSRKKPRYRDNTATACGQFVTLTSGYEKRMPTCDQCREIVKRRTKRSAK